MSIDAVGKALAGKRELLSAGPAETVALMLAGLGARNLKALTEAVRMILGEAPIGGEKRTPDPMDVLLAGIALGRRAALTAPASKRRLKEESYSRIRAIAKEMEADKPKQGQRLKQDAFLRDIAKKAGVSKATVERALKDDPDPY